jgi:hypothetical protein
VVLVLFFRNRPNLEGVYLEDLSYTGNDVLFGSSYFGRKTAITNADGDTIAQLHFAPGLDGTRVEVRHLAEDTLMFHGEYPIDEGDAFYPLHNDRIRISSPASNVLLRFDNETDLLEPDEW